MSRRNKNKSSNDSIKIENINDVIYKSEVNRSRAFTYSKNQRAPYALDKGLSKPGRISYDVLRRASRNVYIIRICIDSLKNKISKTPWIIKSRDPLKKVDPVLIKELSDFFEKPNRQGDTFRTFLDKLLEDLLALDSAAVEITRYHDGMPAELFVVDSATISVVADDHGNQDIPILIKGEDGRTKFLPVSYIQVLNQNPYRGGQTGDVVAAWPKRDMIFFHQHPRGDMGGWGYGFGAIEAIIGVINNILNADNFNSTYFQDGAFPPLVIQLMQTMDQRSLDGFKEYFYQEMEGRFHRPAIMSGEKEVKITNLKDINQRDMQFMDYFELMARLATAEFGLTAADLNITGDINFNTAKTQKQSSDEKGYNSLLHLLKEIFNVYIIWGQFGYRDLEFDWANVDVVDVKERTALYDLATKTGIMTINEIREEMGKRPFGEWADKPLKLTNLGYQPIIIDSNNNQQQVDGKGNPIDIKNNEDIKQEEDNKEEKEFHKSVFTEDGFNCFVSDMGYGQPFIYYNILRGEGKVIKTPIAVDLDSQKEEERISNMLYKKGLNVIPVIRMSEVDILRELPTDYVREEFKHYQNMDSAYDSQKWKLKFGGSRKFPYYLVSDFKDGRSLKDQILIEDMKNHPNKYELAIHDLANIWLAEKKYKIGDRRSDQVILTPDTHRLYAYDFQFINNENRWESTKDSYANSLKPIPYLYNLFMDLTGQRKKKLTKK